MSERDQQEKNSQKAIFKNKFLKPIYMVPLVVLLILGGYFYYNAFYAVDTFTYTKLAMDTVVEIRFQTAGERKAEEIKELAFEEIRRLEKMFDRTLENSDVYNLNEKAGQEPVAVNPEVFYVVEQALDYAALSDGAFDPTIAPVIDLWGFLDNDYRIPTSEELAEKLPLVDYNLVELDPAKSTIYLPHDQMALELGGIAKGFIVDQALEILEEAGIEHAFIRGGGDIGLLGERPDGEPWVIGVANPRVEQDFILELPLVDQAVDTSADNQRKFEEDGEQYHHLLDPETGMPVRELSSVTVVAETTMEADVLSTAAFVLGPEKGLALVETLPGAEGIFIMPDLEIDISSGLKEKVELEP